MRTEKHSCDACNGKSVNKRYACLNHPRFATPNLPTNSKWRGKLSRPTSEKVRQRLALRAQWRYLSDAIALLPPTSKHRALLVSQRRAIGRALEALRLWREEHSASPFE